MLPEDEDVQIEGDTPEPDEVDEESTTDDVEGEPPDYKALYQASEVTNKQLRNDSRSRDGQRNRAQDQEDRMSRLETSVEVGARNTAQILSKLTEEDGDFAARVNKENQEAAVKTRTEGSNARVTSILNGIMEIVQKDSDEEDADPIVLISKANEGKLQQLWGAATKEAAASGSDAPLYRVQMEATRMVLDQEREEGRKALIAERAKSKEDTKKALVKAGVADQDTGPAKVGAGSGERKRGRALIQEALEEGTPLFPGAKSATV